MCVRERVYFVIRAGCAARASPNVLTCLAWPLIERSILDLGIFSPCARHACSACMQHGGCGVAGYCNGKAVLQRIGRRPAVALHTGYESGRWPTTSGRRRRLSRVPAHAWYGMSGCWLGAGRAQRTLPEHYRRAQGGC